MNDSGATAFLWIILIFVVMFFVGGCCYVVPQYSVYHQRLEGEAELAKAESSRRIAILEAKAKEESSQYLAEAEVKRAKGVAEANKIIGDSLKDNEGYLRYLYINELSESKDRTVIYIPTEAGMPILESSRLK